MLKYSFICLLLTIFCYSQLIAQTDSVFILPELIIHQKKHGKMEMYNFNEYDKTKFLLNDSVLKADPRMYNYSVKIKDINKISFRNGNHFWTGAGIGGGIGVLLGVWFWGNFSVCGASSHFSFNEKVLGAALVTSLPFALVGGLLGLIAPKYDIYKVQKVSGNNKTKYLKRIFNKHSVTFK